MFNVVSIKFRFAVSVGANAFRAFIGFLTSLIIARSLHPAGYGDLMFLLGSFVAIRSLLDLGSSSAFFTFLSQSARGARFYLAYFFWLFIQLVVTLALLWLIIPFDVFQKIWLGHERGVVMLAFVATFLQQQVWQMVGQIGEAMRKTVKVQMLNLTVALLYFLVIASISIYSELSLVNILYIIIIQYVLFVGIAYLFIGKDNNISLVEEVTLSEIFLDYFKYCKPLMALAFVGFAYDFADKWMLQRFGGATEQGYFQIANQFAAVSLLATTSVLNIFWKEIADAWEKKDLSRVEILYRKVSRGLVMLGAIISGFLLPWSEQIVGIFLGDAYVNAWPVFAVMLLYPIHQSMGQIGGTMFLASGQTQKYMVVGIVMMSISIPTSYFVLAPVTGGWLDGLELGALGMACKMVALGIVSVNVQAWVIARYGGWKFDWIFQVVGIPLMIVAGFIAKALSTWILGIQSISVAGIGGPVTITIFFYLLFVIAIIGWLPWLIGMDRAAIVNLFERMFYRKT